MKWIATLALLVCITASVQASPQINLMTEEFPPFGYYDDKGRLVGAGVEIVQGVMVELGYTTNISVVPWSRGIKLLDMESNHALFCMARTPEREDKYEWVGPLISDGVYLYQSAGSAPLIRNVQQAKVLDDIAVTANYPEHSHLQGLGFKNLLLTEKPSRNIQMLMRNRIDAIAAGEFALPNLLESEGFTVDQVRKTEVKLFEVDLYVAFSKGTDKKILEDWQIAFERFQQTKEYREIIERYTGM
ncbi:substrate-binding periplasmic protein [Vibrio mexicanus]|uniref:substrate-binding periplasmic protein n=1 Tax=Vibrio mexicanus TaxID=1004326 RepID=UPI00063C6872|nr:transporter substrate-binding domain-containing protein [Vibrio mexicanus]